MIQNSYCSAMRRSFNGNNHGIMKDKDTLFCDDNPTRELGKPMNPCSHVL